MDTGDGGFLALEKVGGAAVGPEIGNGDGNGNEGGDGGGGGGGDGEGLFLVALRIGAEDRGGWKERLARAGVEVYHQTRYTIYVRDPEGNRVGFSHYPVPDGQ